MNSCSRRGKKKKAKIYERKRELTLIKIFMRKRGKPR